MRVYLNKNKEGKVIGWSIEKESDEDLAIIEQIRDMNFWGDIEYSGRVSEGNSDDTKILSWVDKSRNLPLKAGN